jgi:branched-chain amino acid transport system ATP-binding protein
LASDILTMSNVDASYGDSRVLENVSMQLPEGQLLGLLGRNGAGKSTCMNVIVGLLRPRRGVISIADVPVTGLAPEVIATHGVALVPQGRRIFRSLTVRENLLVAARRPNGRKRQPWTLATVFSSFPRLGERQRQVAGYLSGGEQQMLAIGRALMSNPQLLLMDEPSDGLAPQIVSEVMDTIRALKRQGLSIVLVEQNAKLVLDVADVVVVMNTGSVALTSTPARLRAEKIDLHRHLGVF